MLVPIKKYQPQMRNSKHIRKALMSLLIELIFTGSKRRLRKDHIFNAGKAAPALGVSLIRAMRGVLRNQCGLQLYMNESSRL